MRRCTATATTTLGIYINGCRQPAWGGSSAAAVHLFRTTPKAAAEVDRCTWYNRSAQQSGQSASRRFGGWVASTPHWIRATAAEAFVIFCSVGNTNTSQSNGWGQETIIALAGTFNAAYCATRKSRPRFPDTTTTAAAARYDDAGDGADEKPSLAPNASNPWCKVGGHHLTATGEAAQCQRKVCF